VSRWKRPLTAREVRSILVALGFGHRSTEGGHEQWVRSEPAPFRKVTLSAHTQPFVDTIVRYMAQQAGVSVREFYAALDKK
jgi:predicted RNA binding protein YcfA (HicA-like mRNA interferase family)